jgi:hypothetical protein
VDDAGPFDLLRRASQRLNQKLSVVAKDLVERVHRDREQPSGLPPPAGGRPSGA